VGQIRHELWDSYKVIVSDDGILRYIQVYQGCLTFSGTLRAGLRTTGSPAGQRQSRLVGSYQLSEVLLGTWL